MNGPDAYDLDRDRRAEAGLPSFGDACGYCDGAGKLYEEITRPCRPCAGTGLNTYGLRRRGERAAKLATAQAARIEGVKGLIGAAESRKGLFKPSVSTDALRNALGVGQEEEL